MIVALCVTGTNCVALPAVQHVHGLGVALVDLERVHVQPAVAAVDVDHDLGGPVDRVRRLARVVVAQQGEVGDRLVVVEIGAGQQEEAAEHPVAAPVHRQIGQAVEDVAAPHAHALHDVEDLRDEVLEAAVGVQLADLGRRVRRHAAAACEAKRK